MTRAARKEIAQQTVEIVERGTYQSASGSTVEIAPAVQICLDATRCFLPEEIEPLRQEVLSLRYEPSHTGGGRNRGPSPAN